MADLATDQASTTEAPQPTMGPARSIREDIAAYEREYKPWMDRGEGILDRYRDDRPQAANQVIIVRKFNILWSNVQTLQPTLYARLPKAAVERRYKDRDEVGRIACEIAERMGDYMLSTGNANDVFKQVVQDRLLPGRGTAWVSYKSEGKDRDYDDKQGDQITDPDDGEKVKNDDGSPKKETFFEKTHEEVNLEYVAWKDLGHSPVRTWAEVKRVWRNTYMTKTQLVERFGKEKAETIPLDRKLKDEKNQSQEIIPQSTIRVVYDFTDRKVYWVHTGMPVEECILDADDPPVEIEGFWPCPKPLWATMTTGSLIPIADYIFYQDQANELDIVTNRIGRLTDALKIVGAYDASFPQLERILAPGGQAENTLVPVENWALLAEKGGMTNAISLVPIDMVIEVLTSLISAREQIIQVIYQITGIADIIRGSTNPNETATAQQIKGQFASLRIKDTQQDVAAFARNCLRIMIECAVQMFEPKTIWDMTIARSFCQPSEQDKQMAMAAQAQGMEPSPFPKIFMDAIQLLRDDRMRSFAIDIETDSTIAMDEAQDKQDATEFLGAMAGFIKQGIEAVQAAPEMSGLVGELMLFGVRRFRAGRTLEGEIERTVDAIKQKTAQAAQQPPPPNPEMVKVEQEGKIQQAKLQQEGQSKQAELAQTAQNDQADNVVKMEGQRMQTRVDAAKALSTVAPVAAATELHKIATGQ